MSTTGAADGRQLPADLIGVVASVAVALLVVFSPLGDWRPLAVVVGLPFVLLVPGYALVSAAFPRAGELSPGSDRRTSWLARLGLSVAGSGIAIAVVGGVLDFTVWGFQRSAVVAGLSAFTLLSVGAAWYRRRRLSPADRAGVGFDAVRSRTRSIAVGGGVGSVLLTLLVVVALVGAVGVVANESADDGSVVELYVLGEDESGELVAGAYPSTVTVGEPVTVGVGVGTTDADFNGRVVATLERVSVDGETVTVRESTRLGTVDVQVSAGETAITRQTVQPSMAGDRLRMTYRLYRGESDTAFRQVHFWVTVESA